MQSSFRLASLFLLLLLLLSLCSALPSLPREYATTRSYAQLQSYDTPSVPNVWTQTFRVKCPVVLQGDLRFRVLRRAKSTLERKVRSRRRLSPSHRQLPRPGLQVPTWSSRIPVASTRGARAIDFMVALESRDEKFCSGSLLAERWVLTIASCEIDDSWVARIGGTLSDDGEVFFVTRVINHEMYNVTDRPSSFDVALVELSSDAPENSTFVHVYDNSTLPNAGSFAREISYSDFNMDTGKVALLPLDFPIYLPESCQRLYRLENDVDVSQEKGFVCAGYADISRCRVCTNRENQGGPLMQFDETGDIPIQIGLTTFFSLELCFGNLPGVFLQVAPFVEWIESKGVTVAKSTSTKLVYSTGSEEVATLEDPSNGVLNGEQSSGRGNPGSGSSWVKTLFIVIGASVPIIGILSLCVFYGRRKAKSMAYKFAEPQPDSHVRDGSLATAPSELDVRSNPDKRNIVKAVSRDIDAVESGSVQEDLVELDIEKEVNKGVDQDVARTIGDDILAEGDKDEETDVTKV